MGDSKVIVITGASDGIGAAAARELARRGHQLTLVGRSPAKTERVAARVGAKTALSADYASLAEVRALAGRLLAELPRIDVLIHNAGGIGGRRPSLTEDGHEWTIQVNHLAPFLLTELLGDRLAGCRTRVVVTASRASTSRHACLDPDLLNGAGRYRPMKAYATAKLANVAFAAELPARLAGVRAVSFHPGLVRSNFAARAAPLIRLFMHSPARAVMRSPEQGADTMVWLSTTDDHDLVDGAYYIDRRQAARAAVAEDERFRRRLWERTAEAVRQAH